MTTPVPDDILDLDNVFPQIKETRPSNAPAVQRATKPVPEADLMKAKLQKLQEYLRESLADPDPEVAMLGITNADLMKLAFVLGEAIEKVLQDNSPSAAHFETLMGGLTMMLKLTRQIDRFTQLRMLITQTRSSLKQQMPSPNYLQ